MKIIRKEESNTLLRTTLWTVRPDHLSYPFLISITRPLGIIPESGWPAIIATDGNGGIGTLHQAASYFGMSPTFAPSVAVTIGYPLDNDPSFMVARNRDLTPTPWPEWDKPYGEILQMSCPPSGGADAFLDFVTKELMPAVEADAQVDPRQWTLIGHSLGGLFATHALLCQPTRFRRYLACGSSFWWHSPAMFERAQSFVQDATPLDVAVYLTAGDRETAKSAFEDLGDAVNTPLWQHYLEVMGGTPNIAAETEKMAAILGKRRGLKVTAQILPDETHGSAWLAAHSQGLRWLYAALPPS
jgi:uncharacterized protein